MAPEGVYRASNFYARGLGIIRTGPEHERGHLERVREEPSGLKYGLATLGRRVGVRRAQDLMLDRKGFARIKNAPHRWFGHMSRVFSRVLGSIGPNEVMVLRC